MMNRRKFLTSTMLGTLTMASPVAISQIAAEPVLQKWEPAGHGELVSEELFDQWVQGLLQNLANSLGVPYQRLADEFAERSSGAYSSSRALMLSTLVNSGETGSKSKKVLPR